MSSKENRVKTHFNKIPGKWDMIYTRESGFFHFLDEKLRRNLFKRYELTFKYCDDLRGTKVLDIGCGTGRYSIECARRGAAKVVGIDFAQTMIDYSLKLAEKMAVRDKCQFICDDFLEFNFGESFDVILAFGFFDYIAVPSLVFDKISQLCPQIFIASFPKFTPVWGLQRYVRYHWIKKCPIYYYNTTQLNTLFHETSFSYFEIIQGRRGFTGIGKNKI